ncbi:ABC transporter substrate-binding protein [Actinomadura viridis]|uniref:NitT/TauT family transport system substrate-binding protein n=1 Tax=Actinomadura viridis TaxID=58110 RepID=A0A931DSB4_9ACTN|nr:ABC transporter substrate-binding protein [Actinomadura viridis]MBG6091793.1 NitT/TauT family transport system substrate-binding protein [Actinomadura viridis]
MKKHLRRVPGIGSALLALAVITACSPASSGGPKAGGETGPGGTKKVTIQIDGTAVPYYAPLYMAKEQGFFAKAGLDVSFTYAQGSDIVKNVAAGNVDFGFPNGDSVITAYGKGVKTRVVHTTYQQGIGALLSKADANISSPADLKGKTVAVTDLGSPNYIQLQAMLKSANLTVGDVKVKTIGTGAIVDALKNGQVDAIVFSRLRYYALKSAGVDVRQILSDQYLPSFGNVVVAGPDMVKNDPKTVKAFDDALDQGIDYTTKNPAAAVDTAVKKYAPTFNGQQKDVTTIVEDVFVKTLWQSDTTRQHGFGHPDEARWQKAIDAQAGFKLIDSSFKAGDLVVKPSALG